MKNITKTVDMGGWNVCLNVDDDEHLNIYLTNKDDDTIHEIETGQGDGAGEQLALRFTTPAIEERWESSQP
jgi:hypothetical protein